MMLLKKNNKDLKLRLKETEDEKKIIQKAKKDVEKENKVLKKQLQDRETTSSSSSDSEKGTAYENINVLLFYKCLLNCLHA